MNDLLNLRIGPRLLPIVLWGMLLWGSPAESRSQPAVVSAAKLTAEAGKVVIVDARDETAYEKGHIPGAISMSWIELAHMPKSSSALEPQRMADILSSRGVSSSSWVVVYGAGATGFGEEGRLAWTLIYLGHKQVSMLDGGLPAWTAAGLPVTTEAGTIRRGDFVAAPIERYRISKAQLAVAKVPEGLQVIDTRDREEYLGKTKYGESREGHIPGAVSLPWKSFLNPDGTLLSGPKIRELLKEHGIDATRPIALYCTVGVRSAFAFFALYSAGVKWIANYDGSFWEWADDHSLAVTRAEQQRP